MKVSMWLKAYRSLEWNDCDPEGRQIVTLIPTIQLYPYHYTNVEDEVCGKDENGYNIYRFTGMEIYKCFLPVCFRFLLWELVWGVSIEYKRKRKTSND